MPTKGMHPGAVWHKSDFQIHTPRDANWGGSTSIAGGTPETEDAREKWADDFVAACLGKGLSAIALTDHHDFCFIPYVQRAIARRGNQEPKLWLFPGAEVTCNDSVQCLILFDVDTPIGTLTRLFGGHFQNIDQTPNELAHAPQTTLCGRDIEGFIESVSSDLTLSDKSIVLPNATDGGHKTIIRVGFHTRFKELPVDGVYVDGGFNEIGDVAKNKIYGKIEQWGKRRRGVFPTGDNRHSNFQKLGANPCWIRLGEPSAEAIRQAALADEARITYSEPTPPAQRITELQVSSKLLGEDFRLLFNDGFNALIGGRGSGKSAILEYLRFALGRATADIVSEIGEVRSRENDLIESTLESGFVKVTLVRDGVCEVWTRTLSKRDTISIELPDASVEEISISAAQQRFRARAFYQKQLSTIVSDEQSAAEQITGIAAAESVDRLKFAEDEVLGGKRQVQRFFGQLVEYWISEAALERDRAAVSDIKRRIEATRKKLEESGVKSETQAVLDEAPVHALVSNLVEEAAAHIESDMEELRKLKERLPSIDIQSLEKGSAFPEVRVFIEETSVVESKISKAIDSALDALLSLDGAHKILVADFSRTEAAFDEKHSSAIQQQASVSNLVAELQSLNKSLETAETAERRSSSNLKILEKVPNEFAGARDFLDAKIAAFRDLLRQAAEQVRDMSGAILDAIVQTENRPPQYLSALMRLCEGSRIRDSSGKCEDVVDGLYMANSEKTWRTLSDQIAEIFKYKTQRQSVSPIEMSDEIKLRIEGVFGELTPQQTSSIYSRIDAEAVAEVFSATANDFISFKYKDSGGLIPFKQASPGQQASALLHLLLHQQAGTLIIDQPEDDLDNRTVMGIVRLLQTTKQQRQLIFATHNPNFVVNGDADKVVALMPDVTFQGSEEQSKRISIDVDGAIETAAVRGAITEIMEGEEKAFELRSRKYQFS